MASIIGETMSCVIEVYCDCFNTPANGFPEMNHDALPGESGFERIRH